MNGNALKLRRAIEKHKIIGLDTAPFIYYFEDVAPYADLLDPVSNLLENHALHAVTSTVTFAEIRRKPFADKNFSLADEIKFTSSFSLRFPSPRLTRSWGKPRRSFGHVTRSACPMHRKSPRLFKGKPLCF
jgi:hypothetical protein